MIALLQRVTEGKVSVKNNVIGEIGIGLVILLGVFRNDTEKESKMLAEKTENLRIFNDADEKMNLSLLDVKGEALVISQFTLCADYKKGRRPNYLHAAEPKKAEELYSKYIVELRESGTNVQVGEFGAMMEVDLINNGPVTITLDTENFSRS